METLADYIRWVKDLDFDAYPFREADAVVLCNIVYYDLSSVFGDGKAAHTVSDCLPMIEAGNTKLMITGGDLGNGEVFEAAARSKRFGGIVMTDYEDVFSVETPVQFAAVTFRAPSFSFVAYRGTDASVAGWRESCMISFTETEAQRRALAYAERVIDGGAWYIAGHSKGANNAQYAACLLSESKWAQVKHVYLLDGPGFCPGVLDPALTQRIDAKSTRIVPEFDVIGKLFEPSITDTRIVRSNRSGILQHSPASWLIEYGDFAAAEQNDPLSCRISRLMGDWLDSIPQNDRPVFIDELFEAAHADGTQSLDEIDLDRLESILLKITGVSVTTKKSMAKLPKQVISSAIPPAGQTKLQKLRSMLNDLRIQSAGMVLLGAVILLISGVLFELTTMAIIAGFAVLQLVLMIRRMIRNKGRFDEMRGRIFVLIVIFALAAILCFKEQALFLVGSGLYGILCLALAYFAIVLGIKKKERDFLRALNFIEGAVIGLYGLAFLLIPQSVVRPVAITLAACVALDGVLRFGCWAVCSMLARRAEKGR